MAIAVDASQGEVLRRGAASVLARNHMVNLKRSGMQLGRQLAIPASTPTPFPDQAVEFSVQAEAWDLSNRLARDCMSARRLLTLM